MLSLVPASLLGCSSPCDAPEMHVADNRLASVRIRVHTWQILLLSSVKFSTAAIQECTQGQSLHDDAAGVQACSSSCTLSLQLGVLHA